MQCTARSWLPTLKQLALKPIGSTARSWDFSEAGGRQGAAESLSRLVRNMRRRYSWTFEGMAAATTLDSFWRFDSTGFS
jgi:hypothetical protein